MILFNYFGYFPVVLANVLFQVQAHDHLQFNYCNTDEWGLTYPDCNGNKQSPIDFDQKSFVPIRLEPSRFLIFHGYNEVPENMSVAKNRHSVELSGFWKDDKTPFISGGVLDGDYVFAQLHFHWGTWGNYGSEHTINNHSFPLEMHVLHYKRDYESVTNALNYPDGLAVVALFFKYGKRKNAGLAMLENYQSPLRVADTKVLVKPFELSKFGFNVPREYVTYSGSLTTPPCSEVVTWIFPTIQRSTTKKQIDLFRDGTIMRCQRSNSQRYNSRPIQPLNGRIIQRVTAAG